MAKNDQHEALCHLADALAEDIARTPADELLAEVAEDYGNRKALSLEFDRLIAPALEVTARRPAVREDSSDATKSAQRLWNRLAAAMTALCAPPRFQLATLSLLSAILLASVVPSFRPEAEKSPSPTRYATGPMPGSGHNYYLAAVGPFETMEQAKAFCDQIPVNHINCTTANIVTEKEIVR